MYAFLNNGNKDATPSILCQKHLRWTVFYENKPLCTLFPEMKLPLPVPQTVNISHATSTFSPPWSPRTLKTKNRTTKHSKL